MRRTTPALFTLLTLILALLVACGGGTAATTALQASTAPSTAASAAPSAAASAAPSAASATRASPSTGTVSGGATATRAATSPAATATRAAATTTRAAGTPTSGGATPKVTGALTIFAASSLTDAFNEMKAKIEAANPGTVITFNYAASSALRTQLEQGAKADIFASADTVQMDNVKKANLISGESSLFVRNTPVIIVPANNPKGIATAADLAKPGIKLVLAAPSVPIGNYSRQIFDKISKDPAYGADYGTKVLANLVSEEANVRQVVSKVQLGEGDAGIVYASDVTPAVRDQLKVITIPMPLNIIAEYPVAAVQRGANAAGSSAFIAYLLSAEGQSILQKWGFLSVGPTAVIQPAGRYLHIITAPDRTRARLVGTESMTGSMTPSRRD
jgi:molybdate transport system substrate-binding protein